MIQAEDRKDLPRETGVYFFYDKAGDLLYVGKAKDIRSRVGGHFASPQKPWIEKVAKIDFLLLPSEEEALLTERELVLSRRPRYNISLRDDKSYPMIAVSLDEEYPRVYITREKRKKGRVYFGPWTDAKRARKLLLTLPQVFPFRSCSGKEPGRSSGNPCLDYHIGRCGAPCVDYISKEDYRKGIDEIIAFLSGKRRQAQSREKEKMQQAAAAKDYERAALHRDRLEALQKLSPRKGGWGEDRDAVGVFCDKDEASVALLEVREGVIAETRSFLLVNKGELSEEEVVRQFLMQNSSSAPLLLPGQVQRGKSAELLRLAEKNAKLNLMKDRAQRATGSLQISEAMRQLQDASGAERSPLRIEGYDVANIGEEDTVGSMVVFEGGQRKRSHYRTFGIESEGKPDDYRSMAEMIRRRVAAFLKMEAMSPYDKERDESFSALPDLVLVDGGKGQLSAALRELKPFTDRGVMVVAIAKKQEELFSKKGQLLLPPTSPASMLLQRVRDEAHRTSNARHQKLREKRMKRSLLDGLKGVGPKKKEALLAHFGSAEDVAKAGVEELRKVPGISDKLARSIHSQLHRR